MLLLENEYIKNEFISKIATVYINSKNIKEFLFNKQMNELRKEYLIFIENYIFNKISVEPENHQYGNSKYAAYDNVEIYKKTYDDFDNAIDILIKHKKIIGKRIFHIFLHVKELYISNLLTSSNAVIEYAYYNNKCNLFDEDGYKLYELDDKTKLLSVLDKSAPNTLDAATVDEISSYF